MSWWDGGWCHSLVMRRRRVVLGEVEDLVLGHLQRVGIRWTLHHWVVVREHGLVGGVGVVEEGVGAVGGLRQRCWGRYEL